MRTSFSASLLVLTVLGVVGATRCAPAPKLTTTTIGPNDNRKPAGKLANGVLTIELEARAGTWYPDGPKGVALAVFAFAEAGQALQSPGPLIRVPAGTQVHATIHNTLAKPMWLYGMGAKTGMGDSVQIAAGASKDVQFTRSTAGTFAYLARTDTFPIAARFGADAQLNGAMVVDSAGAAPSNDRIFVISSYAELDTTTRSGINKNVGLNFNGIGYPANERLQLTQGDSVHWRFINLSNLEHPLHLHGFYYRVDARGDVSGDTAYAAVQRRMAVTEVVKPLQTMALTFSPERSGNWVFHCHVASHIAPFESFDSDKSVMTHEDHDATADANHMVGLVLAMNVRRTGPAPVAPAVARSIRMIVRSKAAVYGKNIGYAFVLGGSPEERDTAAMKVPGPQLELTRGERVAVTIVNQSHESAAIHWHGIELESFPDGVPGISGDSGSILPHIKAGDSITVRFTPPRAGTFIYHSHSNEFQQISSGLYGALIVRETGEKPAPGAEHVLLLSDGGPIGNFFDPTKYPQALVNGSGTPAPIDLKVGAHGRFRLINIHSDFAMAVTLLNGDKPVEWRVLAKDGFPLTAMQSTPRAAAVTIQPGETYDIEVVPHAAATLTWRYSIDGVPPTLVKPVEGVVRIH